MDDDNEDKTCKDPQPMHDDRWVTKTYLEAKLAAATAKFHLALLVQSIVIIVLVAALYTLFR